MITRTLALVALLVPTLAWAGDAAPSVADDDADLFKDNTSTAPKGPSSSNFQEEDDIVIPVKKPEPPPAPAAPAPSVTGPAHGLSLDLSTAKPFGDNWAPTVSMVDKDAVIVDLPVMYGSGKASYAGKDAWLVAEVYADGKKITESRSFISKDAIADQSTSVQFFRLYTPVAAASGVLEVRVSRLVTGATKNELLFTRSVQYSL